MLTLSPQPQVVSVWFIEQRGNSIHRILLSFFVIFVVSWLAVCVADLHLLFYAILTVFPICLRFFFPCSRIKRRKSKSLGACWRLVAVRCLQSACVCVCVCTERVRLHNEFFTFSWVLSVSKLRRRISWLWLCFYIIWYNKNVLLFFYFAFVGCFHAELAML